MYHYVTDRAFLADMRTLCADVINRLVQRINNDSVMEVKAFLIGSGAKNLITQNGKEPIDLDYNLCICKIHGMFMNEREIKEYVQKQFDKVLGAKGLGSCEDSRSALSTKKWRISKENPTEVSIDLAIARKTAYGWERIIHEKTGCVLLDRYYWNLAPSSQNLSERVQSIKEHPELWKEVRDRYLQKKNMYLCRNDHNHPSFVVYIETINEVYYEHFSSPGYPVEIRSVQLRAATNPYELLNAVWE